MNMDETKLYSWFLGPKAENADMLERLVLEALERLRLLAAQFPPRRRHHHHREMQKGGRVPGFAGARQAGVSGSARQPQARHPVLQPAQANFDLALGAPERDDPPARRTVDTVKTT